MSGDGLIERLRATRATLVANSPQDRAVRDAIMELERLRDVQPYPVPAPNDGSIRVGGRRYQRFNGTWMVQPPMLRGYVPADPVACDWLDEIERLRHERGAAHEPHAGAVQTEPADVVPRITDEQRRQVADAETLTAALWELSEIYRVPLTNNVPFFDNGDPAAPVFHVGDWIQDLIDVFARFPQPQDGPHGR